MIDIALEGYDELVRKIGDAASQDILIDPMQASLYLIQRYMADYSLLPKKPDNGHRTGTLGRRWVAGTPTKIGGGVRGEVGNNTSYGPWVQSAQFQVPWHRGFWQTDEMAFRVLDPEINKTFDSAIQRALN